MEGDGGDDDVAAVGVDLVERRKEALDALLVQVLGSGVGSGGGAACCAGLRMCICGVHLCVDVLGVGRTRRRRAMFGARNGGRVIGGTHAFPVSTNNRPSNYWLSDGFRLRLRTTA